MQSFSKVSSVASAMSRRQLLAAAGVSAVVAATGLLSPSTLAQSTIDDVALYSPKGKIKQAVSKWCFGKIPLEEFIPICKKLGMVGIDLLGPNEWEIMLKNDMVVTMGNVPGASIPTGFNKERNHEKLFKAYEAVIPLAAEKKVPNVICFSGNRAGQSDEEAIEMCVIGLKKVMPLAEKHGVTLVMELLNSQGHKDYHADRTAWGAEVAHKVGSERFKLLYDIYHMQIMEGNLIATLKKFKDVIGHYHTGGNPGRSDIDESQEIYYPAVIDAIKSTGYTGYVAHEFSPRNGLQSLRRAVEICDR